MRIHCTRQEMQGLSQDSCGRCFSLICIHDDCELEGQVEKHDDRFDSCWYWYVFSVVFRGVHLQHHEALIRCPPYSSKSALSCSAVSSGPVTVWPSVRGSSKISWSLPPLNVLSPKKWTVV